MEFVLYEVKDAVGIITINREKALKLGEQWREAGYYVISMRDYFKTIYCENVKTTAFTF